MAVLTLCLILGGQNEAGLLLAPMKPSFIHYSPSADLSRHIPSWLRICRVVPDSVVEGPALTSLVLKA